MTKALSTPSGFALIHKKPGVTSFFALRDVKRRLGSEKVGHTGTLDKFAEGLLIVLCGSLTRLNRLFSDLDKSYEAAVRFGIETDTLDPEGAVVGEGPIPDRRSVEAAIPGFIGPIMQVPPSFSALHVEGKRSYELARNGETVALPPRGVRIDSIESLGWTDEATLHIRVSCSKGTYIRSLARDIGRACGSRACLTALRRVSVGPFSDDDAVDAGSFDPASDVRSFSADTAIRIGIPILKLKAEKTREFRNGRGLEPDFFTEERISDGVSCVFNDGDFAGLVEKSEGALKYLIVAEAGR